MIYQGCGLQITLVFVKTIEPSQIFGVVLALGTLGLCSSLLMGSFIVWELIVEHDTLFLGVVYLCCIRQVKDDHWVYTNIEHISNIEGWLSMNSLKMVLFRMSSQICYLLPHGCHIIFEKNGFICIPINPFIMSHIPFIWGKKGSVRFHTIQI